jgi:hypothetical protein
MPSNQEFKEAKIAKARKLLDQGMPLGDIVRQMEASDVTVRGWLKESFRQEGKKMPDLRSRAARTSGSTGSSSIAA